MCHKEERRTFDLAVPRSREEFLPVGNINIAFLVTDSLAILIGLERINNFTAHSNYTWAFRLYLPVTSLIIVLVLLPTILPSGRPVNW